MAGPRPASRAPQAGRAGQPGPIRPAGWGWRTRPARAQPHPRRAAQGRAAQGRARQARRRQRWPGEANQARLPRRDAQGPAHQEPRRWRPRRFPGQARRFPGQARRSPAQGRKSPVQGRALAGGRARSRPDPAGRLRRRRRRQHARLAPLGLLPRLPARPCRSRRSRLFGRSRAARPAAGVTFQICEEVSGQVRWVSISRGPRWLNRYIPPGNDPGAGSPRWTCTRPGGVRMRRGAASRPRLRPSRCRADLV